MKMSKLVKKFRLKRSPFMLSAVGGMLAIALDFIWSAAEVFKHYGIDFVMEVHILLLTLFPVCFGLLLYGCIKYIRNGYMRKEVSDETIYKKSQRGSCGFKDYVNKESEKC